MKDTKTIATFLIFIILVSIAAGYVAGFFVYRDYKEKTAYFDRQTQFAVNKFGELDKNLKDLYASLESTLDEGKIEKREILGKIEAIKGDIKEWEKGYKAALLEMRQSIETMKVDKLTRMVERLQDNINQFNVKIQDLDLKLGEVQGAKGIDLGRISVGKPKKVNRE